MPPAFSRPATKCKCQFGGARAARVQEGASSSSKQQQQQQQETAEAAAEANSSKARAAVAAVATVAATSISSSSSSQTAQQWAHLGIKKQGIPLQGKAHATHQHDLINGPYGLKLFRQPPLVCNFWGRIEEASRSHR